MQTNQTTAVPDASAYLTYDPAFMTTADPAGLMLCTTLEDVQAVQINACCLALGQTPEALRTCRAFFEAFPQVVVLGADEAARMALCEQLQQAVPSIEVCTTEQTAYHGCTSIAQLRAEHGLSAVDDLQQYIYELPPWGLLIGSQVESQDMTQVPHVASGIKGLDYLIGGLYDGELTVWTGKGGEGKSTALALPILSAIRQGRSCCVYSGEMNDKRYMEWMRTIAAGPGNTMKKQLENGKIVWTAKPEIAAQIDLWLGSRLQVVDNSKGGVHEEDTILSLFRYAHRRYGSTVFVVDNLMTVDLPDDDYYRSQSKFVGHLLDFAHETNSHIHLVAHRKKGGAAKGKTRTGSDEVSGSSDVTKRADNVICVSRCDESDESGYETRLELLKNRDFGSSGTIGLHFDETSRRLYESEPDWKCGWEYRFTEQQLDFTEISTTQIQEGELPF